MAERSCAFHPDRLTAVSCSNCGRPICTDDMVDAAVGVHCPVCAGDMREGPLGRTGYEVRRRAQRAPLARSISGASVVQILLGANVGLFILMSLASGGAALMGFISPQTLLRFGALPPVLPRDEWWRIFSSMFVHIGAMHLLFNMFALMIFGGALELRYGRWRFLALYFASGALGGGASLAYTVGGVRAGASGAVFGILGAWIAHFVSRRGDPAVRGQIRSLLFLVGINLVFGFSVGGIDNSAHIGGLIGGLAIGAALEGRRLVPRQLRGSLVLAAFASVVMAAVFLAGPKIV